MPVHNAYPELPEVPYQQTTVPMQDVIDYLRQANRQTVVKRACYVIFRNESGNGHKGVNNNYIGLQADGSRIADKWTPFIAGTCVHAENMTGHDRRFICLRDWHTSIDFLGDRIEQRGMFVGGFAHPHANMQVNTADDWALAYYREWVTGNGAAQIPAAEKTGLLSMYNAATQAFP
jgi:hypothetical protein